MNELIVAAGVGADPEKAESIAEKLNIRTVSDENEIPTGFLYLLLEADGLSLNQGAMKMKGDFMQMLPRLKPGRLQGEMLIRAARLKGLEHPSVIDATAGMGEDSFLLAAAGFRVYLFEKDPVIAVLLEDALERAGKEPAIAAAAGRMQLAGTDSIAAMNAGLIAADLIYLDPMFPTRKKSGLIKKKFQLLQQLESPCSDEEELLNAALHAAPRKIIVKRPAKGPYLAGRKPSYSIDGKAIRYDCIVP